jgi:acetyl-CoA synthetase (ADP-forming)
MRKLGDRETEKILGKAGIPTVRQFIARTEKEAVSFSKKLGFPVVMKVSSGRIVHKTDAGGVFLGIENKKEAAETFNKIKKRFKSPVLIQEQVSGIEAIVGSRKDPAFGPVIMFGLGGVFVEVLKDVAFRLVPIGRKDAREMVQEIRGYPVLEGIRGRKRINFRALENFLLGVSGMIEKNPQIKELDMNPVFLAERAVAADVRILV